MAREPQGSEAAGFSAALNRHRSPAGRQSRAVPLAPSQWGGGLMSCLEF
jgi:hypothetical protein